jgi:hypothetical protein
VVCGGAVGGVTGTVVCGGAVRDGRPRQGERGALGRAWGVRPVGVGDDAVRGALSGAAINAAGVGVSLRLAGGLRVNFEGDGRPLGPADGRRGLGIQVRGGGRLGAPVEW